MDDVKKLAQQFPVLTAKIQDFAKRKRAAQRHRGSVESESYNVTCTPSLPSLCGGGGGTSGGQASSSDAARSDAGLKRLQGLFKQGLITTDVYDKKQAELVDLAMMAIDGHRRPSTAVSLEANEGGLQKLLEQNALILSQLGALEGGQARLQANYAALKTRLDGAHSGGLPPLRSVDGPMVSP